MNERIIRISERVIEYSYYLLFLLVPLILTPFNYELFEFNKMLLAYAFTAVIVDSWAIKMIALKKIRIVRTPLDIPLILFLLSQIVSTIFSIDRHVSIWGYYSRFNGGLLSTISYTLLYYAFVTNFPKEKIKNLFNVAIISGIFTLTYGIAEHFGIDKDIWVQDVQNRVFSTLGQPNWLAAYLAVTGILALGYRLSLFRSTNEVIKNPKNQKNETHESRWKFQIILLYSFIVAFYTIILIYFTKLASGIFLFWITNVLFWIILFFILKRKLFIETLLNCFIVAFYVALIFTKSRSGFLGFWVSNTVFWLFLFVLMKRKVIKLFLILNCLFIILTFLLGAPFAQINRFTLPELQKNIQTNNQVVDQPSKPVGTSIIDIGITESGTIRNIVWKGAVDIFRHYPLFGAGVESFAFAYYKFRPVEHNLTSEWDFLYNKAHNEYLNYAANSGAFGLGSYLLIILVFIWWTIKNIKNSRLSGIHDAVVTHSSQTTSGLKSNIKYNNNFAFSILQFALFASYASILITNFFGFSVVIIQLFFFLIPAITFVLNQYSPLGNRQATPQGWTKSLKQVQDDKNTKLNKLQFAFVVILLFVTCYLLFAIYRLWQADFFYAKGYNNSRSAEFSPAYQNLRQAILLRNNEPLYYDEIAFPAAALSLALIDEGESTGSAQLANEAIESSTKAVTMSGNNVNFWKTRTRVFYTLSQLDEKYLDEAKSSLEVARTLSPTDPKIVYNLAIIYQGIGKTDEALNLLAETIRLKVDYRDAYFAQALIYEEEKQNQKAIDALNFILNRINPEDEEAKQKLEELK